MTHHETPASETASRPAVAGGALRPAVILGGNRIPFARANTAYAEVGNQEMLTATLDGLVARFGLQGERIGQVTAGAVLKHPRNFNLTREAVLGSALSAATPAADVQVACATGMEALGTLANKIRLGQLDSAIGGGVDSISDAPVSLSDGARRALLRLPIAVSLVGEHAECRQPTVGHRLAAHLAHLAIAQQQTHGTGGQRAVATTGKRLAERTAADTGEQVTQTPTAGFAAHAGLLLLQQVLS